MLSLRPNEINTNDVTQTWLTVPSQSIPTWNSIINFDVTTIGKINEIYVVFNMGPVTGISASGLFPCMVSSFKWFTNVNYSFQGTILDSANSDMNFINCQNNYDDQDRVFINTASGSYASAAQRFAMGQTSSTYLTPIKCFANQIQNEILNANHNFRLSLTLDQLANVIDVNGLTGTPNINFNSISLLIKIQKLTQPTINYKLAQMGKIQRYQSLFTSNLSQQFVALSGSTTSSINLSNFINANIQWIYFTIRPVSTGLTKAASFNYINNLLSFHLLNSSSESLCGGSPITASTSLYILNKDSTRGSYSTEIGGSVFYWFHSSNAIGSYQSGVPSGARNYNGSEQLILNYSGALATNMQIDVYAAATSVFNQTLSGVSRS